MIKSHLAGSANVLTQVRASEGDPCEGDIAAQNTLRHPLRLSAELREVVEAWDTLPVPLRAAVLTLVRTSKSTR